MAKQRVSEARMGRLQIVNSLDGIGNLDYKGIRILARETWVELDPRDPLAIDVYTALSLHRRYEVRALAAGYLVDIFRDGAEYGDPRKSRLWEDSSYSKLRNLLEMLMEEPDEAVKAALRHRNTNGYGVALHD